MTPEQQRALALASARARAQASGGLGDREAQWAARNAAIPQGRRDQQAGIDQTAQDRMTLDALPPGMGTLTSFTQGLPFVGEYTDELAGAVGGMVGNPGAGDHMRSVQDAMQRQHPGLATGAAVAGGIAGSIPLAAAAGPAVLAKAPVGMAQRVLAGAGAGAALGATEGAVSGYGRGQGDGRTDAAITGGAIGGGMGGIVGGAAPGIAAGARSLFQRLKGSDVRAIAQTLDVSPDAARVIRNALQNDDFGAAETALRRAGGGAMLADAGPASRRLLDTSIVAGGRAARVAGDAVQDRAAAAGQRMNRTLDSVLGPVEGRNAISRGIREGTMDARSTAYDRAYAAAIDYSGQRGRSLESLGRRVPQSAINKANELMRLAGEESQQIMARVGNDGRVTFEVMPDVRQWDYITRALGDVADAADGAGRLGGTTQAGNATRNLQKSIRGLLRKEVPEYGRALDVASDAISRRNAAELGYSLLRPGTTREAVSDGLQGAGRAQRDAVKQGLRSNIDDTLANIGRVASDANVDARELQRLTNTLTSRASREKITQAIGPRDANVLFRELDEAITTLELRAAVARNSATAVRQQAISDVRDQTAPGALGMLTQGQPVQATRRIVQALTGNSPEAQALRQQGIFDEIAAVLTQTRGAQAESALRTVNRAMQGQPITEAQAAAVGRALGASSALTGYHTGVQALQTR